METFVCIGTGNLAHVYCEALILKGWHLMGVWSRNPIHAETFAQHFQTKVFSRLEESPKTTLTLLAVSDDALPQVWAQIPHDRPWVLHTSGMTPLSLLADNAGAYGVLYPVQTLSAARPTNLAQTPLMIEASSAEDLQTLHRWASTLSATVGPLSSPQRATLHTAAVFANNFGNLLLDIAQEILQTQHLSFDLLAPLIQETANKAIALGPAAAQTGPARRNDQQILDTQRRSLSPTQREIYDLLSREIYRRASQVSSLNQAHGNS